MCETPAVNEEQRRDERPPAMDDLVGWRDFPKGLRVLLHEGGASSSDIKSKLERMEYSVSLFGDEREALEAVACKSESFHVAIVEVTAANSDGCFRFLETARGLPTIMISEAECIETMMRCIALGAAEFLQKPVSEEKLKNIWQHVVHKAFNAGGAAISKSLKPIKETVSSMLQLPPGEGSAEPPPGSRRGSPPPTTGRGRPSRGCMPMHGDAPSSTRAPTPPPPPSPPSTLLRRRVGAPARRSIRRGTTSAWRRR